MSGQIRTDTLTLKDAANTTLAVFGGSTAGGTWDDVLGDVQSASNVAALTIEAIGTTLCRSSFFIYDRDEYLSFRFQMPHRWNKGTVKLHCHLKPWGAGSGGNVIISGYYVWHQTGTVMPTDPVNWTIFSQPLAVAAGDTGLAVYLALASVAPLAVPLWSDILYVHFARMGATDAADTYHASKGWGTAKANVEICAVDVHVQLNRQGSAVET